MKINVTLKAYNPKSIMEKKSKVKGTSLGDQPYIRKHVKKNS